MAAESVAVIIGESNMGMDHWLVIPKRNVAAKICYLKIFVDLDKLIFPGFLVVVPDLCFLDGADGFDFAERDVFLPANGG